MRLGSQAQRASFGTLWYMYQHTVYTVYVHVNFTLLLI
jgi:hypothetical protein